MLTLAIMFGTTLWLLERLAFALLLLWVWDALSYYAGELETELDDIWAGRRW